MAKVRTPRGAWIDAALQALASGGPAAVRVEALAAQLGVSKGGFYWHFKDRQGLIGEMLDAWERSTVEDVITRVDAGPGDPRAKLRELFELSPRADFAVELALRDWSRRDTGVARRVRGVDRRRMAWMRSLFAQFCPDEKDADARTMLTYSLLIGAYFVSGAHDGRSRGDVVGLAVDHLLGEAPK